VALLASPIREIRTRWREALQGTAAALHEIAEGSRLEASVLGLGVTTLLLDLSLPDLGGIGAVSAIHRHSPVTDILVFTDDPRGSESVAALRAGARAYCHRDTDQALLAKAVQAVWNDEIWVGRALVPHLVAELTALAVPAGHPCPLPSTTPVDGLTPRERQIVHRLSVGDGNKQIASHLNITERTVKAHLTSIFGKLRVSTRVQLMACLHEQARATASPEEPMGRAPSVPARPRDAGPRVPGAALLARGA
jgi:DNA-binding NarL/FixJ family response regulator